MSLLTSFITNQLIKTLESQFAAHEPQMQMAFVAEVAAALNDVMSWVNAKVQTTTTQPTQTK
jgi:hypothetical protein